MSEWELTDEDIETVASSTFVKVTYKLDPDGLPDIKPSHSAYNSAQHRNIAKAAQRKLVEKLERMFNRLISAQSRKDLLESPEWQELRKGVGLDS